MNFHKKKCEAQVLFLLIFLLYFIPICLFLLVLFLLLWRFLHLIPTWGFDHGFSGLLACRLHDGFNAQIVNVVRSDSNIDGRLYSSVCRLACIIAIPSPCMVVR